MPEVKICGNMRREDIEFASGADYLGFIVQIEGSRRSLKVEDAKPLFMQASGQAQTVAVVNSVDEDYLSGLCSSLEPDYLQIMVEADQSKLLDVKEVIGIQLIALVTATPGADERAVALKDVADLVLVDSVSDGRAGGTGKTHDWSLSRKVRDAIYPTMMVLAGGLTPDNVQDAIKTVQPAVVDVASGVEVNGVKSRELVSSFISRAKGVYGE